MLYMPNLQSALATRLLTYIEYRVRPDFQLPLMPLHFLEQTEEGVQIENTGWN